MNALQAQLALYKDFCRDGDNSPIAILFGNPTGRFLTPQEEIHDLKLFQDYIDVFNENVLYSIQNKNSQKKQTSQEKQERQKNVHKQMFLKEQWLRFHYFNSDPFTMQPYKIDRSFEYDDECCESDHEDLIPEKDDDFWCECM
jgi:hypothetical protein